MLPVFKAFRPSLVLIARRQAAYQIRAFLVPTAALRADLIQDLYLRELKNYKVPTLKPSDADGHVQKFATPKAPQSPEDSDIARDLKAYEEQQVEVEGQAAGGELNATESDWFEDEDEDREVTSH